MNTPPEKPAPPPSALATKLSCDRFTASVAWVPAATLVTWRSLPALPTETVSSRSATESPPIATLLSASALARLPTATALTPCA